MGEEGALYTYCDDSDLIAEWEKMAEVQTQAPTIFGKVGLRIGLGPGKTLLILPEGYETSVFLYPLDNLWIEAPHVVPGFSAC